MASWGGIRGRGGEEPKARRGSQGSSPGRGKNPGLSPSTRCLQDFGEGQSIPPRPSSPGWGLSAPVLGVEVIEGCGCFYPPGCG